MNNDVAIFLDLDNLVIGAKQANLAFDINLILDEIKRVTNGRIVLRRSYGDWRQGQKLLKELAAAGFTTQSTIRLINFSKNLADMQIVVDTMDTLIDCHQYNSYVFITGDRDFTPLVQSLRKRGKNVIGVGVKHTASPSLVGLCDHYIYYEQLLPSEELSDTQIEALLTSAMEHLLTTAPRVRASVLKQYMSTNSNGAFDRTPGANGSFRKFLSNYSHIVEIEQEETTIYVRKPRKRVPSPELHLRYRSLLKKQKLRIVPANMRFKILRDMISILNEKEEIRWREMVDILATNYQQNDIEISKNLINAMMLVSRRAQILRIRKGKSLSTAPISLKVEGDKPFQAAVIRCDQAYLREILELSESFDIEEAALALYDTEKYAPYLQKIMKQIDSMD